MSIITRTISDWLRNHPKTRQWIWFLGLWMLGLFVAFMLAYPIKWALLFLGFSKNG